MGASNFVTHTQHAKISGLSGQQTSPMPDFYIGAHALVSGLQLLTRDAARYKSYFPKLPMIKP